MEIEDTPATAGKFAKKLPAFRNILIEVGRNADNRLYERKPTRRTEWKIIEKCNQKVECTDNGHETAVWEVMQKNTEERRYVHHEKDNRV